MTTVERTAQLPADLRTAWRMLSDGRGLSAWLGGDVTLDLRPGGHLSLVRWDGTRVVGDIDEVRPPTRLVVTWWAPRPFGLPRRSRVELTLEPCGRTTVLHVRESQLSPPPVTVDPPDTADAHGDTADDQPLLAGAGR